MAPPAPRVRPSDERALLAASGRTTRTIAVLALLIALVALGLGTWQAVGVLTKAASCQTAAWNVTPATDQLPGGWSVRASTYDVGRRSISMVGPESADGSTQQAMSLATVTCFPEGAADSVTRSRAAAKAAGQVVTDRNDLGDQAWTSADSSGSFFANIRRGAVVAYLAFSGTVTQDEVDQIASAFDLALGGNGGSDPTGPASTVGPVGSETPSFGDSFPIDSIDPGASGDLPSESPAAPDLESLLPKKVGTVQLTIQSALGPDLLGDDQGSRAILAALRQSNLTSAALRFAQAYDESATSDLTIFVVEVKGMPLETMRKLVLDSWLAASGAGVTSSEVTLGGHQFTRYDYGDEGTKDYVAAANGHVLVITTADAAVAEQAAAALP
jgi:hypothetical protein